MKKITILEEEIENTISVEEITTMKLLPVIVVFNDKGDPYGCINQDFLTYRYYIKDTFDAEIGRFYGSLDELIVQWEGKGYSFYMIAKLKGE